MMLFTKDIDKKLFQQYDMGSNLEKQKVIAKIFNPYGNGRWFLINSDPQDLDYLWAIVQMGDTVEVGSVSRQDLISARVGRFRFPLERDLGFSPVNAAELFRGLNQGKFYADGGETEVEDGQLSIFAEGGSTSQGIDLFEDYKNIPSKVQKILDKYEDAFMDGNYSGLAQALKAVEKIGYTFEYYLDGAAYDLRPIGTKGKSEDDEDDEIMAKGGDTENEELYKVVGKKNGQLVDINELPMTKEDAKKFVIKQGIEKYYNDVDIIRYRGNKPRHKMADGGMMAKNEKLIGKQKNIDLNKNGRLDAEDFKMLRGKKMAMGAKVTFDDKVSSIEKSLLKKKTVSPKVQKDYGKTYNKKEALESAQRIAGAMKAKYRK